MLWNVLSNCFPKVILLKCSKIPFWKSWCQSKPWWSLAKLFKKSLCQVQDPQQLSKLFSSVWHSARHFTAATAKIKGSMAGIAKREWMAMTVMTTPIQQQCKMSLGFESDACGIKTWNCAVSCFLSVSVCLLKVIPLLGETKPRNSTQADPREAAVQKEQNYDKSKIVAAKAVEPA